MNLREFTEYLVKSIATESDMVKVQEFGGEDDSVVLEVLVHESDMGAIIGKQGKMAKSLRTLVQAYAYLHDNKRVKINIDSF
jgi:predicted RNA-binding protein YlqC (UPF0109 family)